MACSTTLGENVDRTWIAEFTDGVEMELQTVRIPRWFERAVLDQIVFRGDCRAVGLA